MEKDENKKKFSKNKKEDDKKENKDNITHHDKSDANSGYVCCVSKNIESIRCSRLKLETNLLNEATERFDQIKSDLSDNISKIETLDLHLKHLLLNPDVLKNNQSCMPEIQSMCSKIQRDINELLNHDRDSVSNINEIDIDSSILQNFDIVNENISRTENKISSINETLESINKCIVDRISVRESSVNSQPVLSHSNVATSQPPSNHLGKKLQDIENTIKPFDKYHVDFVSVELSTEVLDYLTAHDNVFIKKMDVRL